MTKPLGQEFAPRARHRVTSPCAPSALSCVIAVFAHNEERNIAACLASLPLGRDDVQIHVLVNGSRDRTADIARAIAAQHPAVSVHELAQGGKSRTWNWMVHELNRGSPAACVFVDGDAILAPGSIEALCHTLKERPQVNAVAGMPRNGRNVALYQQQLREGIGMFGDLYALRGSFVDAIRAQRLRLPDDLVGDDGLIFAWAATNLGYDRDWQRSRLYHAEETGFYCVPFSLFRPLTWIGQYKRMISYAVRHFQNVIIKDIMTNAGATAMPPRLALLYPDWLPRFSPRPGLAHGLFDRLALRRMRRQATAHPQGR